MTKQISLKLTKVQYGGDSIGKDIRIETQISGQAFTLDRTIRHSTTANIDREIASFPIDAPVLEALAEIKVIEKDFLFNDVGTGSTNLLIDTQIADPQEFNIEVRVREWNRIFRKSTAVFTVTLQVHTSGRVRTYYSANPKEDYNRYDATIEEVVDYWNAEFLKDTYPPKDLLDPNLVKAILYQESRVGNDPAAGINVMQVGNPGDPSLRTLRGELPEYWIHNGKQELLKYDAKIGEAKDSIYWGVRWLYHKAQVITDDNRRYWRTWKEAVHEYGPGTQAYTNSVWSIYTKGYKFEKNKKIKLWIIFLPLLLLPGITFAVWIRSLPPEQLSDYMSTSNFETAGQVLGQTQAWPPPKEESVERILRDSNPDYDLKKIILESYGAEVLDGIESLQVKSYDQTIFLAIVERQKDWWEDLVFGRFENGSIQWLEMENPPTEQSILSARWIKMDGFDEPVAEVYGQTHMGHGDLYLYKMNDNRLTLLRDIKAAVDGHNEAVWNPNNYSKYGYGTCGAVYQGDKLLANYKDLNNDGISDIVLTGITDIICEREKINEAGERPRVKVSEVPAQFTYYISNSRK